MDASCGNGTFNGRTTNIAAAVSSNGMVVATFAYEAQGRRVRKIVSHRGTETRSSTYIWDGWLLVRETATDLSTDYVWGKDISGTIGGAGGVGGLLYEERGGDIYVPFYDNNGNITRYCAAQGNVVASYTYDAFGNTIAQSGSMADTFCHRFSTKYFDAEIGLYYYGYRFYSPELMRWLNRDPIEEQGGVNLYAFCGNNPICNYDDTGESFENVANFCAGVGDSLSFVLTRLIRRGVNRLAEGNWDDPADVESSEYFAGEVVEVTVEIAITIGGATLRHTAKAASRRAIEGGARSTYRRVHNLIGRGGEVHHINPIKGHPRGKLAQYPLPYKWAAQGEWNLTWYSTQAEHHAAHARMQIFETIDKYRQSTLLTRQAVNEIINHLDAQQDTKCWDSVDIQTTVFHMEFETNGGNLNAVPESITIWME